MVNKHNADSITISIFQCFTRLFVVQKDHTFNVKPVTVYRRKNANACYVSADYSHTRLHPSFHRATV